MTAPAALHDLARAARYCDRLIMLDKGKAVVIGVPEAVLTEDRIAADYGVTAAISETRDGLNIQFSLAGQDL